MATPAIHTKPSNPASNTPSREANQATDLGAEAFAIVRDKIKGHMYANGLRAESLKINSVINEVYGEFLYAKTQGKQSIDFDTPEAQARFHSKVKMLERFAALAEGSQTINATLASADIAALRSIVEQQKKGLSNTEVPLTDEYFLLYLREKEARENQKFSTNIAQSWKTNFANHDEYLPPVSTNGVGPEVLPTSGRTMTLEQLLALGGPTPLMSRLAAIAYARAPGTVGKCAGGVNRRLRDLGLVAQGLGNANEVPAKLAIDSDFVEITGVSKEDLNRLPEGCFVSFLDAGRPSWYGHNEITTDPAKCNGISAASDHRQRNRIIYGGNISNIRVFAPRGGIKNV